MAENSPNEDVVEAEQAGEGDVETELSRDMSLFDITFIGVGAMIGAGVFALTGFAAGLAGPALTVAFILNGAVAMFTAVSYAELGAAFPEAGGGYLWVKEALVDPNGFYAGWMSWFAHAVACSLYAVTFGTFFVELLHIVGLASFPAFGFSIVFWEKLLAVLMISAFAYINFRGAEETGKAGVIVTGIKVVILGLFIGFGIWATIQSPNWTSKFLSSPSFAPGGWIGIVGAMGFTYIAFEGYEIIVQSGEEVVNPGKNVPKAVFYSMAIVVPIYVLVSFAAIGGIDITQHLINQPGGIPNSASTSLPTWKALGEMGELGIIEAAGQFVPYGAPLLLFAGLAATMSALNATVYSSSRVSFAMGRDRALPSIFDKIHTDKRTPHWAILISGILIAAMAVTLPIEAVAASADIMFILLFLQVNWTVIRMRQTHPDLPRTYKVPYMPWPPLIGIALQFFLMPFLIYTLGLEYFGIGESNHGLIALIATAAWMLVGLGVYYGYSKQQEAKQIEEETPTVVSHKAPRETDNQIVVPISNPENAQQLMQTAVDLARDEETYPDGGILVMSVVTVPQQTPPSEGREFIQDEPNVLEETMEIAREAGIPVSGTVRIGHDVSDAILNTVEQYDSDVVLMGWKGQHKTQRRDIVLGSNVDEVVQNAPCDVLIERIGDDAGKVDSILVPIAGGPHSDFAADVADTIASSTGANVELVHVVDPNADDQEARKMLAESEDQFREHAQVSTTVLTGDDIVDTIVSRTNEHDLTIVGATREGLLQQFVFGAIPEQIGWRSKSTTIMAKQHQSITSYLQQWF
ncbi:amino acid permease [Haladaptatus sp. DYF46]|uniref:amino acid permease n=1 Tax=Haladaptatus sp. DYF46 TaxID=2886041 RepID=UPI001E4659D8|nr:amino acid permease [Haladaptatus sp. DYF46]